MSICSFGHKIELEVYDAIPPMLPHLILILTQCQFFSLPGNGAPSFEM